MEQRLQLTAYADANTSGCTRFLLIITSHLYHSLASDRYICTLTPVLTVLGGVFQWLLDKKNNQTQSWLPAFWKKRSKTHEIKRTFFNWMKQDKTCKFFEEVLFFKLRTAEKQKKKKTNNSAYLVSVRFGRLAWVSLMPFSFHQPPVSNWHKTSWMNCLFFCFYIVRSLKKRTSWKICTFCPVSSD